MDKDTADRGLEWLILGLVVGALAFAVLGFGAVRTQEWLVVQGLVALAALVWAVRLWLNPSQRLLWPPVCWGVLLFAGWAVWRYFEAPVEYVAREELLRILAYAALFLVAVCNLHRQSLTQAVVWSALALGTALSLYALFQYTTGADTVWGAPRGPQYGRRGSGSFVCPNHFAGFLELLLPLALAGLIAGRMKAVGRILIAYALLTMLVGMAVTMSRGGFLGAAAGLALVLLVLAFERDYRLPALAGMGVILAVIVVMLAYSQALTTRFQRISEAELGTLNGRVALWQTAREMWREHFWLGAGPGHFDVRHKEFRPDTIEGRPLRAHNDYLNALADWGVAGAAVAALPWLLVLAGVLRTLPHVRRAQADLEVRRSNKFSFVLGASAGLVALLVHAWWDFNFHIPANAILAVLWLALLSGYLRFATDRWWVSGHWALAAALTLLVLAFAGVAVSDVWRRGREAHWLGRAAAARSGSPEHLAALRGALAVEPRNPDTAGQLGEVLRALSMQGGDSTPGQMEEALRWFTEAARLNPFDPRHAVGAGLSLDWLGRTDEAEAWFLRARQRDPHGRSTKFYYGWHLLQRGDWDEAEKWLRAAIEPRWFAYRPAFSYLELLRLRRREQAGP